jgi:hypothetical protein
MTESKRTDGGVSGVFGGVKRHSATTTATAPTEFTAPVAADATGGVTDFGMDDNDVDGCCFEAAFAHGLMCQASVGLDPSGAPTYAGGFVPPTAEVVKGWYDTYLESQGQPTTSPGSGTDITSGVQWFLDNVDDVEAVGIIAADDNGGFDPRLIREAIFDTQGGAVICWALDQRAQQEFDDDVCWGAQSANPDYEEGHATNGAVYDPSDVTVVTWARLQCTTDLVDQNCIDGLVVFVSKGLRAKLGDAYADGVIAKWGLTKKAAPVEPPAVNPPPPAPPAVESEIQKIEDDIKAWVKDAETVLEDGVKRFGPMAIAKELQTLLKDVMRLRW